MIDLIKLRAYAPVGKPPQIFAKGLRVLIEFNFFKSRQQN